MGQMPRAEKFEIAEISCPGWTAHTPSEVRPRLVFSASYHELVFRSLFPPCFFSTFAHVSFSATVRLDTNFPGLEAESAQKYPRRSN